MDMFSYTDNWRSGEGIINSMMPDEQSYSGNYVDESSRSLKITDNK